MFLAIVAGVVVGLLLGALGGGGSILTVPVLVYGLGQGAHEATTASLVIVGVSSLTGAIPHLRAGNVRFGQGVMFGLVGVAGSYLGSKLASGIDEHVLLAAFSVLLLVVAATMIRKALRGTPGGEGAEGRVLSLSDGVACDCPRLLKIVVTATGVGMLTGFFGVGGGFAVVPALALALGFTMPVAVGTSLVVIVVNSFSAFAFRSAGGIHVDWAVVLPFTLAAVAGSLVGGRLVSRVSPRTLSLTFAIFLVLVAAYTAARSAPALL